MSGRAAEFRHDSLVLVFFILFVADSRTHSPELALSFFFFNHTATTQFYTLSLHDALPISPRPPLRGSTRRCRRRPRSYSARNRRSEEHTSELQSHLNLVCRLLLEKKK